jgi:hypothetical protein
MLIVFVPMLHVTQQHGLSRNLDQTLSVSGGFSQGIFTKTPLKHPPKQYRSEQNMRKHAAPLLALTLLAACLLCIPFPSKAANRTIIVPDDYPTVRDAIGNATAGDTILVKKGTYDEDETLEIGKTLTLTGEDTAGTVIILHPPYNETWVLTTNFITLTDAITIKADDVKLSNLTVTMAVPGGHITTTGKRTQIINNRINAEGSSYINVAGSYCNITDNLSGASISLTGTHNNVARNAVSSIDIYFGDFNFVSNNMGFINGVRLTNATGNVICGNNITTVEGDFGICILGDSSHNQIYANSLLALNNAVRISSDSAENNTFYHNNFLKQYGFTDLVSLYTYDLSLVNFWDNGSEGNYWEGYNFTDANRDGIGDSPFVIDGDNRDNYPLMFPFDIESDTGVLPPPEPFPTIPALIIVVACVVVACAGLLLIRKSRKRSQVHG